MDTTNIYKNVHVSTSYMFYNSDGRIHPTMCHICSIPGNTNDINPLIKLSCSDEFDKEKLDLCLSCKANLIFFNDLPITFNKYINLIERRFEFIALQKQYNIFYSINIDIPKTLDLFHICSIINSYL